MYKLLIVEDDDSLAVALRDGFEFEGYSVRLAKDGPSGLRLALVADIHLIVLDVMLPGLSGLELCNQLRKAGNSVPVVFLTVRSEESDKILGLKLGADDYVTKPFSFMELACRVEAVLRRVSDRGQREETFQFSEISVDLKGHRVIKRGNLLELSSREFEVFRYLLEHRGHVVSRNQLLDAVWGYENYPFTRTVDVHIAKLRKKLEDNPNEPNYLITVHGFGYKLVL